MNNQEAKREIYLVGLGNSGALAKKVQESNLSVELPSDDGEFSNARHNIGLNVARQLVTELGLPPMQVDPLTVRTGLDVEKDSTDEMWVAATTAEVDIDDKEKMSITVAYPGRGINASAETLRPWLESRNVDPGRLLILTDDASLPPGKCELSLVGPADHNGYGPISQLYCGLIPTVRIGVDEPTDREGWSRETWDFSDPVKKRAASFLREKIQDLARWRVREKRENSPIQLDLPRESKLRNASLETVSYWQSLTAKDIEGLRQLDNNISLPLFPLPLHLPSGFLEGTVHPTARRLSELSQILISRFKTGDPAVQKLIEISMEPVDDVLLELYRFQQYPNRSRYVAMGVDNCWDFMLTPTGDIQLTEGDRNGGSRADIYLISQYHLNHVRPGVGDDVTEARKERLNKSIADEYQTYCEQHNMPQKDRPSLFLLIPKAYATVEALNNQKDFGEFRTLRSMLSEKFDTHLVTEDTLRTENNALYALTTEDQKVKGDILWHIASPTIMDSNDYYPIAEAIVERKADVLLVDDPAKDLVFLNKPLFALLRDRDLMRKLFGKSFNDRLPEGIDSQMRVKIGELFLGNNKLREALNDGQFDDNLTPVINQALDDYLNHNRILTLTEQVINVIPYQVFIDAENADSVESLIGKFYFKGYSFSRFGGRGTAGPSEGRRARQILDDISRGNTKGVAVAPVDSMAHPLFPGSKAELRVWQSNARIKGERRDLELRVWQSNARLRGGRRDLSIYADNTHYVRVSPPKSEKVNLSREGRGGITTVIAA